MHFIIYTTHLHTPILTCLSYVYVSVPVCDLIVFLFSCLIRTIYVYNFSDNLKTLFRPISMMLPDLQHVAEIELLSYGYENAKSLGTKIVTMFQLCGEQLIAQPHYDFGMRALKIVLEMCERAKIRCGASKAEEIIAVEIIRQTIFCMLDDEDVNIFEVYMFEFYY